MRLKALEKICMVILWEQAHRYSIANGSSASLSFSMGMIWDHRIVWDNYGNQVPIGIPYQLLKHACFTCTMEMIWDRSVT